MNEIFKKKSAVFYVISQNVIKKNKKNNYLIGHTSPEINKRSISLQYSNMLKNLNSNRNSNKQRTNNNNNNSFSLAKSSLNDLQNNSELKTLYNNNFNNNYKRNIWTNLINKNYKNDKNYHNIFNYSYGNKNKKNTSNENNNNNNFNFINSKYKKWKNTTQIIQKKIRYHDLNARLRKKQDIFYSPIFTRNKNKNKEAQKEEEDPFLTIYGVLFDKDKKRNLKSLKKNKESTNVANSSFDPNKLLKNNIKMNSTNLLSLPWLISNKNKNTNMIRERKINKNTLKKRMSLNNDIDTSKYKKIIGEKLDLTIKNNINDKQRKLISYDMTSIGGRDFGKIKINQDNYFIIPKINNCEEIKIFGVFDGHGDNGKIISKEIRDFFENYFLNLQENEIEKDISNSDINANKDKKKYIINLLKQFKNNNKYIFPNFNKTKELIQEKNQNLSQNTKYENKKISCNLLEESKINIKNIITTGILKSEKIKKIYKQLSDNNYTQIYSSYKKINDILHTKYDSNRICHFSGSTSLLLFIINYKNCNKIITTNLGDSKIISISENNTIKELNIVHTPNNPEEKNRIIKNGGVIGRIEYSNIGPLRIWYKNKKYPGLSITRSFGDFESYELGVKSEPDIKEYDIDEEKIKIIIFGTDGIFKFLTKEAISNIALSFYEKKDANGAVNKISETAIKLWEIKNPKGIADVTVFVLFFK